ncbi:MAG: hypothetical protein KAI25_00210 [Hyphomicrobiaceae bacterium]|nr:hypothetical protein [Hyphomicrobiaceae bacterium]
MGRIRKYECGGCEHRYYLLEVRGELCSQDRLDDCENITCPTSEGDERREVAGDLGRLRHLEGESKFFPHYNRALGMTIRSEAHLKQVCDAKGLVPWSQIADGDDYDLRVNAQRRADREKAGAKRYRAMIEQYKTDPEYKEAYYKLEEQGAYRPLKGS